MERKIHILLPAKISPTNLNRTLLYFSTLSKFPKEPTLVEVIRSSEKGDANQCFYILELCLVLIIALELTSVLLTIHVRSERKGEISILLKTAFGGKESKYD